MSENVITTNAKKLRKNFRSKNTPLNIETRKLNPSKILKKKLSFMNRSRMMIVYKNFLKFSKPWMITK